MVFLMNGLLNFFKLNLVINKWVHEKESHSLSLEVGKAYGSLSGDNGGGRKVVGDWLCCGNKGMMSFLKKYVQQKIQWNLNYYIW